MLSRRGFLGALFVAPAIIKVSSLMPIKALDPIVEGQWHPKMFYNMQLFPEMSFTIEKVMVTAKSRMLKAEYAMELPVEREITNDAVKYLDRITERQPIMYTYNQIVQIVKHNNIMREE